VWCGCHHGGIGMHPPLRIDPHVNGVALVKQCPFSEALMGVGMESHRGFSSHVSFIAVGIYQYLSHTHPQKTQNMLPKTYFTINWRKH